MKIAVLGGSPKGETSVTMQYVRWIRENLRGHEIETFQIASRIAALERDEATFASVIEAVQGADAVLWAFPLYVFTVCSQYKRFIELVWDRGAAEAFRGKYAASLSTSIHFFDHTAHEYIRGVSEDLGMAFTASFSPKMDDLKKPECRKQLLSFAEELVGAAEKKLPLPRRTAALPPRGSAAGAPRATEPVSSPKSSPPTGKRVLVLVDYPELAVGAMARRYAAAARSAGENVELLGLEEMGMKGGCLGCLKCGQANHCAYEGKDGFIESFRSKVMTADLLVFAGTIKDRAFSARWKAFFDRSFFNTHQRTLMGKQFLILAAGPLSVLGNLRETLQAYVEWQGGNLVDFVSDEAPQGSEPSSSHRLDELIDAAAARSGAALAAGAMKPATFLGVGGMKIFRDDIYDELRIVFKADHRAYKKEGVYDFPQRNPIKRFAVWLGYWITSIPAVYRGMIRNFPDFMIMQYKPVFARSGRSAKVRP
ncbi:MAG: NAD(P)H-dependent oxidoreductase [Rectinemataceae bacterium]|jgi:multimeric flavodoxin WrbA